MNFYMKKVITSIILLCIYSGLFSQSLDHEVLSSLKGNLHFMIQDKDHVVYEWHDRIFVLIVKLNTEKFVEFSYEKNKNALMLKDIQVLQRNACLDKMFDFEVLSKNYTHFQSDLYKNQDLDFNGASVFFASISSDWVVHCAFRLTTLLNILPYDSDIHWFLLNRIHNNTLFELKCDGSKPTYRSE
jgi:hypothetical protein